jgi:hypothetical protein
VVNFGIKSVSLSDCTAIAVVTEVHTHIGIKRQAVC